MRKPLLGTTSTKKCPQCGGSTVIERAEDWVSGLYAGRKVKIRRCDELVEIHPDKPLEPCEWNEEIYANGKPVKENRKD